MKHLALLLLTLLINGRAVYGQVALEERLVQTEHYQLNLKIQRGMQSGLPTLILESGGGLDSTQWAMLQPQLSRETGATVVSYDRAGYGKSPLPVRRYDILEETDALHEALSQLGLADKVLIIGHSYGAMLVQVYANHWQTSVQGLLFVEPNTPSAMLGTAFDTGYRPKANPQTPNELAMARLDAVGRTKYATVYQLPLPLDIPIVVITAETRQGKTARQLKVWRLSHDLLAASVEDGKVIMAERSDHMVTRDRPDLIVAGAKELLAKHR